MSSNRVKWFVAERDDDTKVVAIRVIAYSQRAAELAAAALTGAHPQPEIRYVHKDGERITRINRYTAHWRGPL